MLSFCCYYGVGIVGYLSWESSKNLIWVIIFEDAFTSVVSKISNSCPEIELFILDWPGVGPMRQFVLKWIRTVVGPPLATRNLGSLALHCWVWRVRALWPTFVRGGCSKWGQVRPPAPIHRLSNLGLMNSLEDTVQACAWPRSGLASLLVELLAGPGAQKTFSCDLPSID